MIYLEIKEELEERMAEIKKTAQRVRGKLKGNNTNILNLENFILNLILDKKKIEKKNILSIIG